MKLNWILVLTAAALLPGQSPAKPKTAKQEPAIAAAPGGVPATLDDLQRDFQIKKLAALEAYVKVRGTAKDVGEAIVEAAGLAKTLARHDQALRYADLYLKDHGTGPAASEMRMVRAGAMRDTGDAAGAEKALREVIDGAGNDNAGINSLVEAATMLGEMLVANGKKAEAVELLTTLGDARSKVRGLKEHFAGIVANYELIGTEPIAIGQPDLAGKTIDLAEYKGKVVLLDFWATWCGPCVAELPNVIAAYEKYHGKGFEIVGISLDEDRAALDKFLADKGTTWRQHFDGKGWKNEVAVAYGVQSIPATYLIGPDGKIAAIGLRGEQLHQRLAKLLSADKAAAPAAAPKGK